MVVVEVDSALEANARKLYAEGMSIHEVEDYLVENGVSRIDAVKLTTGFTSNKFESRRKRGFLLIGVGSFLLIFGFLLTVIMYHNGMPIGLAMYGPTIAGALLVMGGLVLLFN
jgi:hypothetical protein